ncbi:hypothetical protein C1645_27889 [Glomus cerebriforme]|uniref:Uncharacterized protein n=1 Tax=Glomus cerebriforme TaxID=658196 RepID=A0A397S0G9_9GLOM|nr:hypothetical protein C1645_27889 [Glomus cerebriforme]
MLFQSSVQSDYVLFAKIFIIIFLIIELLVRIINLLQMKNYDSYFDFGDCLGILCIKKESYLVFSSEWIELSQIIKLADIADDTCFIIPTLFLLHIIIYFIVHKEDPTDTSYSVDNICKYMEIILSLPAMILVMTRIWFIIKTIDYARKVDDDDDNGECDIDDWDWDCCCGNGGHRHHHHHHHHYYYYYDDDCCRHSCECCGDCCNYSFGGGLSEDCCKLCGNCCEGISNILNSCYCYLESCCNSCGNCCDDNGFLDNCCDICGILCCCKGDGCDGCNCDGCDGDGCDDCNIFELLFCCCLCND